MKILFLVDSFQHFPIRPFFSAKNVRTELACTELRELMLVILYIELTEWMALHHVLSSMWVFVLAIRRLHFSPAFPSGL
jgi:hypothetical protein